MSGPGHRIGGREKKSQGEEEKEVKESREVEVCQSICGDRQKLRLSALIFCSHQNYASAFLHSGLIDAPKGGASQLNFVF